jgi:hypothetical protein
MTIEGSESAVKPAATVAGMPVRSETRPAAMPPSTAPTSKSVERFPASRGLSTRPSISVFFR